MKRPYSLFMKSSSLLILCFLQLYQVTMAQVKYHSKDYVNLLVSGSSTLHDWDMKSAKGNCTVLFNFNKAGELTGLSTLKFVTPVEGLKSGHSGMDRNAYNALKADKNPTIVFIITSGTIEADSTIKCNGKLTIAGLTKDADLMASYKINADKSVTVSGIKKISMSDFNITAPSFMMGAIKTGNEITFKFDLTLSKQ